MWLSPKLKCSPILSYLDANFIIAGAIEFLIMTTSRSQWWQIWYHENTWFSVVQHNQILSKYNTHHMRYALSFVSLNLCYLGNGMVYKIWFYIVPCYNKGRLSLEIIHTIISMILITWKSKDSINTHMFQGLHDPMLTYYQLGHTAVKF